MESKYSIDRQDIINKHDLLSLVEDRGYKTFRSGKELTTSCCPITTHGDLHRCVNISTEKQTWYCNDCCEGGSIIDWYMKESNMTTKQAMEFLGGEPEARNLSPGTTHCGAAVEVDAPNQRPTQDLKETEQYNYTDENGTLLYQVVRYEPKTFKQRQPKGGEWQWDLQGITRVLYNLPQVLMAQTVCVTEGEKDADNLSTLGFTATTTAGGAQSWLPAYAETLKGKDVIIFEDSDNPGRKRGDVILESLQDVAASVKRVRFSGYKDVSDWLKTMPTQEHAKEGLRTVIDKTPHAVEPIPIYSAWEREEQYIEFIKELPKQSFGLGNFSKSLGAIIENIYPGELVMLVGDTGQGKTAVMQAIARSAAPLPTVLFELELPLSVMYQREVQIERGSYERDVIRGYTDVGTNRYVDSMKGLHHVWICPQSGISMDKIEKYITKSELKIGEHPRVIMIDYMGLVPSSKESYAKGRYETMAYNAQMAKVVAKRTNTIMFMGSQIARPQGSKEAVKEIHLHHAKGAGELGESSNLILGVTRPDENTLKIKVVKFTRGKVGDEVLFNFDGPKLQLTERMAA